MSNKSIEFTAEQLAVVTRVAGEFVVIASAGSGKTSVLSERYQNLVENYGVRPSQVLTITFTKKAAAEMKRRIVDRLRDKRLFKEAQEAETGPIQTIHSFYERVLRENSPAAGLDPRFEVVSGGESARLKRDCIKRAISYAEEENDDTAFVLKQLAGKADFGSSGGSYDALVNLIDKVLTLFRDSGHQRNALQKLYHSPGDYLRSTDEDLKKFIPAFARPEAGLTGWQQAVLEDLKREKMHRDYPWLKTKLSPSQNGMAARYIVGISQLCLTAWALLDSAHQKANQLDFSSLESLSVRLIETNEDVRDRLNRQYRHVMVDEAQDLNPNQIRLIGLLQPESKMLVGDDKQSIYLFRNAVGDFIQGFGPTQIMRLTKNFRSEEPIQAFVDQVFGTAMGDKYRPMTVSDTLDLDLEPWKPSIDHTEILMLGGDSAWHEVAKRVGQLQDSGTPLNDIAIITRGHKEGQAVAKYLKQAGIGVREGAGKSNYYAKLEVRDICNTLIALSDPDNRFALLACLRSPVCDLSLDAIVQIGALEGNPFEFVPSSQDDQFKFEQFKRWFVPLSSQADRLPAWEVISGIMADSGLLVNLAKRSERRKRIENVRKLLVMAAQKPELSALEYADMIQDIEKLSDTEPDPAIVDREEDLVTTLTIHAAKGLEWPVVIIPDAMKHSAGRINAPVFDPERGWLGYWSKDNRTYAGEFLIEQAKAQNAAELTRIQYVAATRAKKKLILVAWPGDRKGLIETVRNALGNDAFQSIVNRVTE